MLIPSNRLAESIALTSLSRGMNANSQLHKLQLIRIAKSIKRDEC